MAICRQAGCLNPFSVLLIQIPSNQYHKSCAYFMHEDNKGMQIDSGLKQTQKDETHWRPLGYISTNFFN